MLFNSLQSSSSVERERPLSVLLQTAIPKEAEDSRAAVFSLLCIICRYLPEKCLLAVIRLPLAIFGCLVSEEFLLGIADRLFPFLAPAPSLPVATHCCSGARSLVINKTGADE